MISNGSTVYHSATMVPPGPPLHFLYLGNIPVPLKTTGLVQCDGSSDRAHLQQLFLPHLSLLPWLDYYMRQPRPTAVSYTHLRAHET